MTCCAYEKLLFNNFTTINASTGSLSYSADNLSNKIYSIYLNTTKLPARLNIPTIERADFLGELTRAYKDSICISGTHGKTTTTSMLSHILLAAKKDPTISVGGIFASDGFARGNLFHGMPVRTWSDIKDEFGRENVIVLLSFGSSRPEVLENVLRIRAEAELRMGR